MYPTHIVQQDHLTKQSYKKKKNPNKPFLFFLKPTSLISICRTSNSKSLDRFTKTNANPIWTRFTPSK